jgi:hypothetical protein
MSPKRMVREQQANDSFVEHAQQDNEMEQQEHRAPAAG